MLFFIIDIGNTVKKFLEILGTYWELFFNHVNTMGMWWEHFGNTKIQKLKIV
jgi:hypothetical protein